MGTAFQKNCRLLLSVGLTVAVGSACSKQPTSTFKMNDRCENFRIGEVTKTGQVRSKVDLLFVVDNSGSMETNQNALSAAFDGFTNKYLKPASDGSVRDIKIAVITTDTFLAGNGGNYPADYATLKPGIHDGIRPELTGSRSGRPILSTVPPTGAAADAAYFDELVSAFNLNSRPGTDGSGSESGMDSVVALLEKNEKANQCNQSAGASNPLCFFRSDSVRVIVFFSDAPDNCGARTSPYTCVAAPKRVANFRSKIESYLKGLDVNGASNYMAAAIVAREDNGDGATKEPDKYVNYEDLIESLKADSSNTVGQRSYAEFLDSGNVDKLLDNLGANIESISTQRFSNFKLARPPASIEKMNFNIILPGGKAEPVPTSVMSLIGTSLTVSSVWLEKFPPEATLEGCYPPESAL